MLLFFSNPLTAFIPRGNAALPRPRKFALTEAERFSRFSFSRAVFPYIILRNGFITAEIILSTFVFFNTFINPDQKHIIPRRETQRDTASDKDAVNSALILSKFPVSKADTNETIIITEKVFESILSPVKVYSLYQFMRTQNKI